MERKLIVLLMLFCACFSLTAQKTGGDSFPRKVSTKYFDAEVNRINSTLYPKDMVYPEIKRPGQGNEYTPIALDKMFIESYKLYKKAFGKLTPAEEEVLFKTTFVMLFNSSFKVVYFTVYYPADAWDQLPGLEKRLHRFGHAFEDLDLRPYVDMNDESLFDIAPFSWQMRLFTRYDKSRNMKYLGGGSLYILPAKQ